jgi:hypothetical protein
MKIPVAVNNRSSCKENFSIEHPNIASGQHSISYQNTYAGNYIPKISHSNSYVMGSSIDQGKKDSKVRIKFSHLKVRGQEKPNSSAQFRVYLPF